MKINWKCWIPVLGIFYAMVEENSLIILYDTWVNYQFVSVLLFLFFLIIH